MNTTPAARRHLQSLSRPGHTLTCVRGVGGTWQATCSCGWKGTPMRPGLTDDVRASSAHRDAVDQFRAHVLGLEA